MSCFDVLGSLTYSLIPWTFTPTPSGFCSFEGAMIFMHYVSPFYSTNLRSISFTRYGINGPRNNSPKTREFGMHRICIIPLTPLKILALSKQSLNPSQKSPRQNLIFFAYAPLFAGSVIVMVGSNILIYLHVRRLERRTNAFALNRRPFAQTRAVARQYKYTTRFVGGGLMPREQSFSVCAPP